MVPQNRDGSGRQPPVEHRFRKGRSGNPGGRPKSFGEYIREQTNGGKEIVDLALGAMRHKRLGFKLQLQAAEFLTDRGWGRPVQQSVITWDSLNAFAGGQVDDVRAVLAELVGADRIDAAVEQIRERWMARAKALDTVGK